MAVAFVGGLHMSDDAPRWTSFSSAFSIVLSLASDRIAELGCAAVGVDPKAFVDRGGLRRLETEAADAAIQKSSRGGLSTHLQAVWFRNASRQRAQTCSDSVGSRLGPALKRRLGSRL